jgi:hypothetical protein
MHRRRLSTVAAALILAFLLGSVIGPGRAAAAPVVMLSPDGTVHRENNRFISAADSISPAQVATTAPSALTGSRLTYSAGAPADALEALRRAPAAKRKVPQITVVTVLAHLLSSRQITAAEHTTYLADWNRALAEEKRLSEARSAQLEPVTEMLHDMAVDGTMTASRLPVLFLTLEENATYWKSGPMLSYGARVQFAGSELEWQYYTGEGIQLQVLGTFGEANGFYAAGPAEYPELEQVMSEMLGLAVQRGGGLAWEYYFDWEGGAPPWISAMAQGTGLEALTRLYEATHNATYLTDAHDALGILETAPPTGVAVRTTLGDTFLQYNFEPRTDIINAFLQTLIGLDDYATASGDQTALALFDAGNAQAQAVLPSFDTGAWSQYQPGEPDDLSYHQLVTGFLQTLCSLTGTPIYCSTAKAFTVDLRTPPVITQVTQTAPKQTQFKLYFTLDKPAHVGVVIANASGRDYLYTSADADPGADYWIVPKLPAGTYSVKLSGTDLAGNFATTTGSLTAG